MTKKFVHTDKDINGRKTKNEFLIPDIFEGSDKFLGLTSLTTYSHGMIIYTGEDLDETKVLEKVSQVKSVSVFKHFKVKKILRNYLSQIKGLKIGDTVKLGLDGTLKKVDLKKYYYKRNWEEERIEDSDNWGESIWYLEVDSEGFPIRQIEKYNNGKILKYSEANMEDEFGGLGDQAIDREEFNSLKISQQEFEKEWCE